MEERTLSRIAARMASRSESPAFDGPGDGLPLLYLAICDRMAPIEEESLTGVGVEMVEVTGLLVIGTVEVVTGPTLVAAAAEDVASASGLEYVRACP